MVRASRLQPRFLCLSRVSNFAQTKQQFASEFELLSPLAPRAWGCRWAVLGSFRLASCELETCRKKTCKLETFELETCSSKGGQDLRSGAFSCSPNQEKEKMKR